MKVSLRDVIRLHWQEVLLAMVVYATALVYQGYLYGSGDQTQILPCIWAQDHPDTYTKDHYVQTYNNSPVNERTVIHFLWRFTGYASPWMMWIWHMIASVALILAWMRITGFFIKRKGIQAAVIGALFTIGYHTATGSNEIYYPSVVPSLYAKALASWAIVSWLTDRFRSWAILLAAAAFLQPLVGIQVFIFSSLGLLTEFIIHKRSRQFPLKEIGLFLLFAVPWFFLLARNNGAASDAEGFLQFIRFRLPHHFLASSFGIQHLILFVAFSAFVFIRFTHRIRWGIMWILIGCVIYEVGAEMYHSTLVIYTQWWKTSIWIEAFAFLGIAVILEKLINPSSFLLRWHWMYPFLLLGAVVLYRLGGISAVQPPNQFPWNHHPTPDIEVSLLARELTPIDAVFIVPIDMTAFRWYARRNLYIDYKAMLHQQHFLKEWYARLQQIYQFGIKEKEGGFEIRNFSHYLLAEPSVMSIAYWKKLGITHIISPTPDLPDLQLLGGVEPYYIYQLP